MSKILLTLFFVFSGIYLSAQSNELQKLFSKGKHDLVIEKGLELLKQNPNDPVVNLVVGRSYAEIKKYGQAIPFLEKVITEESVEKSEDKTWAFAYLGKCYFVTGEAEKAKKAMLKCENLNPSRSVLKYYQRHLSLFQMDVFFANWETYESENIIFHFQNKTSLKDSDEFVKRKEKEVQRICDFFEEKPAKKIDYFVWEDKVEAYQKFGRPLSFSNKEFVIINSSFDQENDYEVCNLLCNIALSPKRKSMLFGCGLAVYFEKMNRNLMAEARKSIPKDRFYTMELWEQPTKYERDLSCPVGAALIEFLINKGGKEKLKNFLKEQTIANASKVYPDFENWMKDFDAMLLK